MKKVSIIIPCREINEETRKCAEECLKLDYDSFEILILPDFESKNKFGKKAKIISTGRVKPAVKRNLGMKKSKAEYYAFIDSDAYPDKNWLKNALKYFKDEKIGIAGGPNLTPENAGFWEKVSGYVLENFFVSGYASIRYKVAENRYVKELPSCNYIARKKASCKYSQEFLTAEDSEFCFNCIKKGFKVLYANDVVVYHHRRNSFSGHVKQMFIYARDISWLTKKDFSFDKLYYSLNSLGLLAFILFIVLSFFFPVIKMIFLYLLFLYLLIILFTSLKENLKTSLGVFIASILTHFAYGFGWLYGLISRRLETEKVK